MPMLLYITIARYSRIYVAGSRPYLFIGRIGAKAKRDREKEEKKRNAAAAAAAC